MQVTEDMGGATRFESFCRLHAPVKRKERLPDLQIGQRVRVWSRPLIGTAWTLLDAQDEARHEHERVKRKERGSERGSCVLPPVLEKGPQRCAVDHAVLTGDCQCNTQRGIECVAERRRGSTKRQSAAGVGQTLMVAGNGFGCSDFLVGMV